MNTSLVGSTLTVASLLYLTGGDVLRRANADEAPQAAAVAESAPAVTNGKVLKPQEEGPSTSAESKAEPSKPVEKKRQTHKVRPRLLKIEETLEAHVQAAEMKEILLRPETWTNFKLKEVVPHGATVQKGTILLAFESEELEKAIADLEIELRLSELKLLRSEAEFPRQEQTLERELADAKEMLKRSREDFDRYQETERDQELESAKMSLKMSKFWLDYTQDEWEQLKKMYEADDLTEETEELILKRHKTQMEFAEYDYKQSKYYYDLGVNVMIPRRDRDIAESLKIAEQRLDRAEDASQLDLNLSRYELEKAKADRKKSLEQHVKLLADRDWLTIESPAKGVVYYGDCVDGKWGKIADLQQKLKLGRSIDKETVLMTVVDLSSLRLVTTLDERLRTGIQPGQAVKVIPTVEGAQPLEGTISLVSDFPSAQGKFTAQIALTEDPPAWLVPGMSGKVKVVTYEKQQALTLPKSAVHTDDATDKTYVWRMKQGKPRKTWVETGRTKGELIEITSGLSRGDVISLDKENPRKD